MHWLCVSACGETGTYHAVFAFNTLLLCLVWNDLQRFANFSSVYAHILSSTSVLWDWVSINDTDLSVLWRPVAVWYRCCRHGVKLSGRLFRRSLTWSHHLTSSRPISPDGWQLNTTSSGWHSQYTADGLFSSACNTNGSIVFVMQSCDMCILSNMVVHAASFMVMRCSS